MHKGFVISVMVASALAVTATSAASATAGSRLMRGPDGVTVEIVTTNGSGCTERSHLWASVLIGADQLVVSYGGYSAQSGGSSIPPDRRKNCRVVLKLNVPEGFTYAISSSLDTGYAHIEAGAKATVKLGHFFEGAPRSEIAYTVNGAFDDDWEFIDHPPSDSITWKPCGEAQNLVFTNELAVDQGTADPAKANFISMDSLADRHHHLYDLAWKACP